MSESAGGGYAYWELPGSTFRVTYSLSTFHEIDFQVNEGYRRIPHGGIETGGLLYGTVRENEARIEAFRPIECEHSMGPSFVLSERDVAALRAQIASGASDPDLSRWQLLGWFVAHTRSELRMNERERALFDELFAGPYRLMMLVKPERFQPTRFAFLVRAADGAMEQDGSTRAIILPLPGQAKAGAEPAASIPAPDARPAAKAGDETRVRTEPPVVVEPEVAAAEPEAASVAALEVVEKRERPAPEAAEEPGAVVERPALPSVEEIRRRRAGALMEVEPPETRPLEPAARMPGRRTAVRETSRSNARLAAILFVAAALGCGVGYSIYLQLPPATIPLNVQKRAPSLIVSWPPEQTRDAVSAALRVDDGDPIPLSSRERNEGQAAIRSSSGNTKIELIARHRTRESRGIVRFVEPLAPINGPPADTGAAGRTSR